MTPSESFTECYRICGESVVPAGFGSVRNFTGLIGEHPRSRAINAGIVHLQAWLVSERKDAWIILDHDRIQFDREDAEFTPLEEYHDGTPSSIFTALCSLAGRVAK